MEARMSDTNGKAMIGPTKAARLAYSGGRLTPAQLRELARVAALLAVEAVDLIPQISEARGRWFRLDGNALVDTGRIIFEKEEEGEEEEEALAEIARLRALLRAEHGDCGGEDCDVCEEMERWEATS